VSSLFRLDNKVALVTGASRGIGAAVAHTLSLQGAAIALLDLHEEDLIGVAAKCVTATRCYAADVSNVEQTRQIVQRIENEMGRIDILVNNAGVISYASFEKADEDDWDRVLDVNAKGQYFLMQAVCPVMKRHGGGRIINLASMAGRIGSAAQASIYSGSKGAVAMFSKSVAREVAADGILVNCVAPGLIETSILANRSQAELRNVVSGIPLKRLGKPEEVAALIAFLASDECSYCTGAMFDINGGMAML
jgi:NAD(P)-dependent dehydrogenase (short-subunit alcohol dehydrogenase family)